VPWRSAGSPGEHHAAGDGSDLGGAEHLADLGAAELDLFVLRLEHALEGRFDLVDRLVDHRSVVAELHTLAVGQLGGLASARTLKPSTTASDAMAS